MKYLKLALVFIGVLGGIVIGLNFDSIKNIIIQGPDPDSNPIPSSIEKLQKEIDEGWKQRNDWDEEFFIIKCNDINSYEKYYPTHIRPLFDANTRLAVERVDNNIFAQWRLSSCNHNIILKYITAIGIICKYDNTAKNNSRIQSINNVNETYKAALVLAGKDFKKISILNNGVTWTSYNDYVNRIKNNVTNMLNNANYRNYLSNITAISQGLNSYRNRMHSRASYYTQLESEIVNYYKRIAPSSRNEALYEQLRMVYFDKFNNESGINSFAIENLLAEYESCIEVE